jgi:hypothetical protein
MTAEQLPALAETRRSRMRRHCPQSRVSRYGCAASDTGGCFHAPLAAITTQPRSASTPKKTTKMANAINPACLAEWRRQRGRRFGAWIARLRAFEMPEIEVADHNDLIQQILLYDSIAQCDDDMPQPDSDDSYNYFVRHNPYMCLTLDELHKRAEAAYPRLAARLQEEWEESQRRRQLARERTAARLWAEEEAKREARYQAWRLARSG